MYEFSVDGDRFALLRHRAAPDGFEAVPDALVGCVLRRWVHEAHGSALAALRDSLGLGPLHADASELADRIAEAVATRFGGVELVRHLRRRGAVTVVLEVPVDLLQLAEDPAALLSDEVEPDHWIEVHLLDASEQPLADERYEIVLPDGDTRSGRTDALGVFRIDPLMRAGNCRVYFPDLEQELQVG